MRRKIKTGNEVEEETGSGSDEDKAGNKDEKERNNNNEEGSEATQVLQLWFSFFGCLWQEKVVGSFKSIPYNVMAQFYSLFLQFIHPYIYLIVVNNNNTFYKTIEETYYLNHWDANIIAFIF